MSEYLIINDARVMVPDAVVNCGRDAVGTFAEAIEAGISADDAAALVLPTHTAPKPAPLAAPIADEPPTEDDF